MAGFQTFERDLRVATAGLEPKAISARLAQFARAELARVIANGEGSKSYDKYVNGRKGAIEESVTPPGPILYIFSHWEQVIVFALAELVKRSPKRSGRYIRSFVVTVNGAPVTNFSGIDTDATIQVWNRQPYSRKIEIGAMAMSVPPHHFDSTTAALRRKFAGGGFKFTTRFINVPGAYSVRSKGGKAITHPAIIMSMAD